MRQEIEELALEIFDTEEIYVIDELIQDYCGSDDDYLAALSRLRYVIPRRPKRPMYYVHHQIGFLPEASRFVVEQSGSYLDLLMKELRYEMSGKFVKLPLGTNVSFIRTIKSTVNPDLSDLLKKIQSFNQVAYVPAKHIYGPPTNERHYFEVDDSILIAMTAVKLCENIKKRSQYARNLCQDLVLPGQQKIQGNHQRTDFRGIPFDFTKVLLESKHLNLDIWGKVID